MRILDLIAITPLVCLTLACTPDATTIEPEPTEVRLINALVGGEGSDPGSGALDLLVNGSTESPGAAGLEMGEVRGFESTMEGMHDFEARFSASTGSTENLFGFPAKQYLTPGVFHTVFSLGILPAPGAPATGAVEPLIIEDDPFAPPRVNGVYQTRFKFINAAPDAGNPAVRMYVTPGSEPLSSVAGLSPRTSHIFGRRIFARAYINMDAGEYVATFVAGSTIVKSVPVTLGAGEVRTFVLLNTHVTSGSEEPGPGNHAVLNLLDASY